MRKRNTIVQPFRRAAVLTQHIGIPPYTDAVGMLHYPANFCQSYLLTLSDAISQYGLLLKIAITTLIGFPNKPWVFRKTLHINAQFDVENTV